ncbi:MAG: GNAT family N-acetyltransferase [Flavitalea sp.]
MSRPDHPQIILRKAGPKDLGLLLQWDQQQHVIASDPNDDWNWEEELQSEPDWRQQFIAELDGRPIGFIQIIDPSKEITQYWGTVASGLRAIDIWIGEANDLGKGYGTSMMELAISICFEEAAVTGILIDPLASNKKAHRFYKRLGFQFQEEKWFGEDLCCVYRLFRSNRKA